MSLFSATCKYVLRNFNDSLTYRDRKKAFSNAHKKTRQELQGKKRKKGQYQSTFNSNLRQEMKEVRRKSYNREKFIDDI